MKKFVGSLVVAAALAAPSLTAVWVRGRGTGCNYIQFICGLHNGIRRAGVVSPKIVSAEQSRVILRALVRLDLRVHHWEATSHHDLRLIIPSTERL